MNAPLHHTPGGGTSADSPPRRSSSSPQHLSTDDNCNNSNNSKHCNSNSNNNNSMTVGDSSTSHQPMRNYDGTEMRDASSRIVYKSQFLTTHPLRTDCKERVGYGGKKFTYVSGDGVIRTMNAIFGHGGWSTQITMERCVLNEKDERGRWCVGYLASVKVTLLQNGVSHEDCGTGEGIDNSKIKSHEKALKSAITDAMKRAARHFGERMGNALYVKGNSIRTAPRTNKDALAKVEREDALSLFGDQAVLRANYENESNNSNNNNNNLQSPEKKKLGPNNTVNTIVAVGGSSMSSNSNNNNSGVQKEHHNRSVVGQTTAGTNSYRNRPSPTNIVVASSTNTSSNNSANQMDNRPQNPQSRMAGQHAAAAPNAYHNRQPPNNVVVGQHHQQQEPTSLGEASTNKKHNNVNSGAQKENWPQNRMPGQNIVAEQNSYHNRVSPNNLAVVGQQHQQQPTTSFGSAVLPSPIASNGHRAGSMAQQNHGVVVRPGNPSTASDNSNNNMHHHQHQQPQPPQNNINLMNAPQPPSNLMAPPPRPMYNPHGGTTQYNSRGGGGGGGGILNNNNNNNNRGDKRRSLDAGVSSHNNNNGGNNSNMNNNNNSIGASYMDGNNNINSNNNGDNNAKRKKGNPYNNSNKRMSV